MAATISGTALSTIFFDNSNCKSDQEGFLLGQIVSHLSDEISDSQIDNVKEETSIQIYGHLPCSSLCSFYDSRGNIQPERIKSVLKDKLKDVIGWYKFRNNSSLVVSMREHRIHRGLMDIVPVAARQHFLYCLCVGSVTTNMSTYSFDHTFMKFNGRRFQPVSVTVANLGSTSPSDYKMRTSSTVSADRSLYSDMLTQCRRESNNVGGGSPVGSTLEVLKINNILQQKLSELCIGVVNSGKQLADLEEELKQLRQKWKNCQRLEADREMNTEKTVDRSKSSEPLQPPPRPPKTTKTMSLERGRSLQMSPPVSPIEVTEQSLIHNLDKPMQRLVPKPASHHKRHVDLDEVVNKSTAAKTIKSTNPFATDILSENIKATSKQTNPFLSSDDIVTVEEKHSTDTHPQQLLEKNTKRDLLDSVELWDTEGTLPPPLLKDVDKSTRTSVDADERMHVDDENPSPAGGHDSVSVDLRKDTTTEKKSRNHENNPFSFIEDVIQKAQPSATEHSRPLKQSTLPRNAKMAQSAESTALTHNLNSSLDLGSTTTARMTRTRGNRVTSSTSQEDVRNAGEVKGHRSRRQRPVNNQSSEASISEPGVEREVHSSSSSPTF